MKKKLALIVFLIPFFMMGQKVKAKYDKDTQMVSIDGKDYVKIVKVDCSIGDEDCHYDIYNSNDEVVIQAYYETYRDPSEVSEANTNGTVRYMHWFFLKTEQECESKATYVKPKNFGKYVYEKELMIDGVLNQKAIDAFVKRKGMKHTEAKKSIIKVLH